MISLCQLLWHIKTHTLKSDVVKEEYKRNVYVPTYYIYTHVCKHTHLLYIFQPGFRKTEKEKKGTQRGFSFVLEKDVFYIYVDSCKYVYIRRHTYTHTHEHDHASVCPGRRGLLHDQCEATTPYGHPPGCMIMEMSVSVPVLGCVCCAVSQLDVACQCGSTMPRPRGIEGRVHGLEGPVTW